MTRDRKWFYKDSGHRRRTQLPVPNSMPTFFAQYKPTKSFQQRLCSCDPDVETIWSSVVFTSVVIVQNVTFELYIVHSFVVLIKVR